MNPRRFLDENSLFFCGNFRQNLHVIPRDSISDIMHATINDSYILDHCKVLKLTNNMRLQTGASASSTEEIKNKN